MLENASCANVVKMGVSWCCGLGIVFVFCFTSLSDRNTKTAAKTAAKIVCQHTKTVYLNVATFDVHVRQLIFVNTQVCRL